MIQPQETMIKIVVHRHGLSFSHAIWQGDVRKNEAPVSLQRAQEIIDANPEGQVIKGSVLDFGPAPANWKWQVLLN